MNRAKSLSRGRILSPLGTPRHSGITPLVAFSRRSKCPSSLTLYVHRLFSVIVAQQPLQKSLRESLQSPEFFVTDFAKFDRPATLHSGFQALSEFRSQHNRLPRPRNAEDAAYVVSLAKKINDEADEKVVTELSYQASGDISPMAAVIGGFVAQEVLKACSAKFHPMVQHMYFDSLESRPTHLPSEEDCKPIGSRYDGQIAVFGKKFQERVANHRQFLVGSGAIGCEMLKNWSMMGLGAGPNGIIHVTDLDTIEKSNLNRQFLFRAKDLGKFKAEVAADAVSEMNPDLAEKILSKQEPVGPTTEGPSQSFRLSPWFVNSPW